MWKEAGAIGAKEALDYLWILNISSIPDPSTAWKIWYFDIWIATNDWYKHIYFSRHSSRSSSLQFLSLLARHSHTPPERSRLCGYCSFLRGWGHEAGGREMPGRVTQPHTQNGRETARAKEILVWAQITSCFTSWIKASALEADIIYNAQIVQTPTQSRRPPRNREQVNELCTEFTRKFT